jgi:hypothetical protein
MTYSANYGCDCPPSARYPLWFINKIRQDAGEFDDWEEEMESEELDTSFPHPEPE